jgi:hypothetical protein
MILIDDILISDDIVSQQFICNLTACKGACCVEGDAGAPLAKAELKILEDIYADVKPYLTPKGIDAIAAQGNFVYDKESKDYATPLIDGAACAYIVYDPDGTAKCGIEKAYNDGVVAFRKPISCHLYPIRVSQQKHYTALNYDRWSICKAACKLGKAHQVAVYEFLKEPLIRRFGTDFYETLDATAKREKT